MTIKEIIAQLKHHANPRNVAGMARYGINPHNTLGVNIPIIRSLAKKIGTDHRLALKLWDSKIREARILASIIADPSELDNKLMEKWVRDFDSWDICDQVCCNLFVRNPLSHKKVFAWVEDQRLYVRRAGFVMMAEIAMHDKKADNRLIISFLPLIKKYSIDERNLVKKAISWAIRRIGRRNKVLEKKAYQLSLELKKSDSPSARFIAGQAIDEFKKKGII